MIENFNVLADRLKGLTVNGEELTPEKLFELHSAEDKINVESSDVVIMTNEDFESVKERVGRESAKKGSKTLLEMEIKRIREEKGLDFEGKTIENLLEAAERKALETAKIPEAQKVKDLSESLERLRGELTGQLTEKENIISQLTGKIKESKVDSDLWGVIPKELAGLNQKQAATLIKSEYHFDYDEEGNQIVMQGGKVVKDKYEKPIGFADVVNDYVARNNWIKPDGRGGKSTQSTGGSDFKTMNDLMRYMEQNQIDPLSKQGLEMIDKFEAEKP